MDIYNTERLSQECGLAEEVIAHKNMRSYLSGKDVFFAKPLSPGEGYEMKRVDEIISYMGKTSNVSIQGALFIINSEDLLIER